MSNIKGEGKKKSYLQHTWAPCVTRTSLAARISSCMCGKETRCQIAGLHHRTVNTTRGTRSKSATCCQTPSRVVVTLVFNSRRNRYLTHRHSSSRIIHADWLAIKNYYRHYNSHINAITGAQQYDFIRTGRTLTYEHTSDKTSGHSRWFWHPSHHCGSPRLQGLPALRRTEGYRQGKMENWMTLLRYLLIGAKLWLVPQGSTAF